MLAVGAGTCVTPAKAEIEHIATWAVGSNNSGPGGIICADGLFLKSLARGATIPSLEDVFIVAARTTVALTQDKIVNVTGRAGGATGCRLA